MPYIQRIVKAGKTIEIERYYAPNYLKRGMHRGDRVKPTREEQRKVNTRKAERQLRILMNANFKGGDFHIVLNYIRRKDEEPITRQQMKDDIAKFLRAMRKEYKAAGQELKYIHVAEIGSKGARHHHLVVNYIDTRTIQKCWMAAGQQTRPKIYPLDDSGQYKKLAAYFIKYTDKTIGTDQATQGRRWNPSRNLYRPEPQYRLITDRAWYRAEPKIPYKLKGKYYVDLETVENGVHNPDYSGYGFFRYTLIAHPT